MCTQVHVDWQTLDIDGCFLDLRDIGHDDISALVVLGQPRRDQRASRSPRFHHSSYEAQSLLSHQEYAT